MEQLVSSRTFWYAISVIITLILGIAGLWLKYGNSSKKIRKEIKELMQDNNIAHKNINKQLKLNTVVVQDMMNKQNNELKFEQIKVEALRWAPEELSKLIVLKSNSMKEFFSIVQNLKFQNITISQIRAEIQVLVCKFRQDASEFNNNIISDFIDYFFDQEHDVATENYIQDLEKYKKSKINNVNEAFVTRSLVFYRHALESLLDTWHQYKNKGK